MRVSAKITMLSVILCAAWMGPAQHIYEPRASTSAKPTLAPGGRIDINHATLGQLMKALGITRIWADRIVRFRPYHAKNELLDRGILPGRVYHHIKDAIIAHRDAQ